MSFAVKEIFKTLQGEGAHSGRAAVFCRFAGCNLWSGREIDRAGAVCTFCDTDFVGGARYASPGSLVDAIESAWAGAMGPRFVVLTGGEPMLQVTDALLDSLHARGFTVATETNGTIRVPSRVDWICVSPKATSDLRQQSGDELKLVFPQLGIDPEMFLAMDFARFYLQPMDGPNAEQNLAAAVAYCMANPIWRLSLQTHKLIGLR